jgi:hypothetical protein
MSADATEHSVARWYEVDFITAGPPKEEFTTQVQAESTSEAASKARADFPYAKHWTIRVRLVVSA